MEFCHIVCIIAIIIGVIVAFQYGELPPGAAGELVELCSLRQLGKSASSGWFLQSPVCGARGRGLVTAEGTHYRKLV